MLVVAPEPVFTPRGTPFSVYQRLAMVSELGVEADLLTYAEGMDPDLAGLTIHRIPSLPFLGPVRIGPSIGKFVRDVLLIAWTVGLLLRRRPSVVHAHEEAIFWCRLLKPVFGFKLIYDMHSSLPQQLENFDFTSSKLLIGVFRRLEAFGIRGADVVLTISPALAEVARGIMRDPERLVLLENSVLDAVRLKGVGIADDRPAPREATVVWPNDWPESTIILYAGTLEPYQGIDLLLAAFARVLKDRPDSHLVVLGGTSDQVDTYEEMADELGVREAAVFAGQVAQPRARGMMSRAAVLVSPRIRGNNTPLKVYELLASGVPFVATRIESHTQVLDDSVCVLADPEPEAFADALLNVLGAGNGVETRVARARRLYDERYSRMAYRSKLADLLGRLGAAGPRLEKHAS